MVSLFARRKSDFEAAYGVRLFIKREACTLEVSAEDEAQAKRAAQAIQVLVGEPRLSARLPAGLGGWLFGNGQANLKRLEARASIHHVWVDDDIASVSATSEREAALREIVKPATGELVVPPNKNGVLIGKARERLNRLEAASGCAANNSEGSETWVVRGASATQVETFIGLATSEVYGSVGHLIDSGRVSVLPDPAPPTRGDAVGAWRANNPAFFAEFPQATLVALASLTRRDRSGGDATGLKFEPTGANDTILRLAEKARGGDLDSLFALASALESGTGVDEDSETALDLYLAAANAGHVESQFKAATLHDPAYQVDDAEGSADLSAAITFYRKAATAGHVEAMFNLADLLSGEDTVLNLEEAEHWASAAAEAGHPREQLQAIREARNEGTAEAEGFVEEGETGSLECETLSSVNRILLDASQLMASRVYVAVLPCYRSGDQWQLAFARSENELQLPATRQGEDETPETCVEQLSEELDTFFDEVSPLINTTYVIETKGEPAIRIVVRTYLVRCAQRAESKLEGHDLEWLGLDDASAVEVRDLYVTSLAAALQQLQNNE